MRLEPGSFDAVYSIEGTSYAPTLEGVYTEIFRVLKPGGTFAVYELVMTDAYNNDNLEQREIRLGIEQGLGITNLVQASQAIEAIKAAGFELEEAEDLASRPNEIPWYYPITGSLRYVNSIWDAVRIIHMALLRRGVVRCLAGVCEKLGFFPPGTQKIANSLSRLGDSLVKSGEKKLFTPIFIIVAKKPLK
jgi:sterol 24-C-methyltransferase